jgi:hypothetical protein
VVAKVKERLAVSKQVAQIFDVKRFNLRKITELEIRKNYRVKILNSFVVMENLNDSKDISRYWET